MRRARRMGRTKGLQVTSSRWAMGQAISTGSTRPGKHRRNEALAGLANQHRISSGAEGLEPVSSGRVMLDAGLGSPDQDR